MIPKALDRYGGHYSFAIGLLLPFGMVANNIAMVMVVLGGLLPPMRSSLHKALQQYRIYAALVLLFIGISVTTGIVRGIAPAQLANLKGYLVWLLPLVATPWFDNQTKQSGFLRGAQFGFSIAIVWSLGQFLDHYMEWDLLPGTPRTSNYRAGFFDNALTWTGVISLFAIAMQGAKHYATKRLGIVSWASAVVVGFSMQRTYWLAYPMGTIANLFRTSFSRFAMVILLVFAGTLFVIAANSIPGGMQNQNALLRTIHARFSIEMLPQSDSVQVRKSLWSQAIDSFRSHPVLGSGPGTFRGTVPGRAGNAARTYRHAHNGYLTLLAESGISGFLLLFAAFFCLWRQAPPAGTGLFVVLAVSSITEATVLDSEIGIAFCLWFSLLQQRVQLLSEYG